MSDDIVPKGANLPEFKLPPKEEEPKPVTVRLRIPSYGVKPAYNEQTTVTEYCDYDCTTVTYHRFAMECARCHYKSYFIIERLKPGEVITCRSCT